MFPSAIVYSLTYILLLTSGGCRMHGLIFVTWEKYLSERFGTVLLQQYRSTLHKQVPNQGLLLASRIYDDNALVAGVGVASQLTHMPVEILLREYGRYFQINGLTNHFCAYVVNQFHSGRELMLAMGKIHAQLQHVHSGVTPPLFKYELSADNPQALTLIYDSERQLCPVLLGAIEGAAERYREKAQIVERTCMKQGAPTCRFEVTFIPLQNTHGSRRYTPDQIEHHQYQAALAHLVLSVLPVQNSGFVGITLQELQKLLQQKNAPVRLLRPAVLLDALLHLSYAGLVGNSAHQLGSNAQDDLTSRRYWRASIAPTHV